MRPTQQSLKLWGVAPSCKSVRLSTAKQATCPCPKRGTWTRQPAREIQGPVASPRLRFVFSSTRLPSCNSSHIEGWPVVNSRPRSTPLRPLGCSCSSSLAHPHGQEAHGGVAEGEPSGPWAHPYGGHQPLQPQANSFQAQTWTLRLEGSWPHGGLFGVRAFDFLK